LFEELGFPYTGSDAYVMTVTLDKWMTKLVLGAQGIDTPRARLVVPDDVQRGRDIGMLGLAYPVLVKPNFEGSSKGIGDDAVARDPRTLADMLPKALRRYPAGLIVEEFVAGTDVTVPFLEGAGDEGVLLPVDYVIEPAARSRFNIYDYRLKSAEAGRVAVRCPPTFSATWWPVCAPSASWPSAPWACAIWAASIFGWATTAASICSRSTLFRRWNAVQHLRRGGARGARLSGGAGRGVASAARRQGMSVPQVGRRRRGPEPLRIGFTTT